MTTEYPDFPEVDLATIATDPAARTLPEVIVRVEPNREDRDALVLLPDDLEFDAASCADCDGHIGACLWEDDERGRSGVEWAATFLTPEGAWVCEDCALERAGWGQP